MLKEFKNFIMTGNVIDFAVAVIMAGALGAVVNGFVTDIAYAFCWLFCWRCRFCRFNYRYGSELNMQTVAAAKEAGEAVIAYGNWINTIINLIIVGFVMFMIVKAYNKTKTADLLQLLLLDHQIMIY